MKPGLAYDGGSVRAVGKDAEVGKKASQLPKPVGYWMLLALADAKEETEGGILIPQARLDDERAAAIVAVVIAMGPDCYNDKERFPNGPWCKRGDCVLIRSYGGNRISIHDKEFRMISDDNIMGVVEDPSGIARYSGA